MINKRKIKKGKAIKLINEKIELFKKVLKESNSNNVYGSDYYLAYYGAKDLITQLFSEDDAKNFDSTTFTYDEGLSGYRKHIERCIVQLQIYIDRFEQFEENGISDAFEKEASLYKRIKGFKLSLLGFIVSYLIGLLIITIVVQLNIGVNDFIVDVFSKLTNASLIIGISALFGFGIPIIIGLVLYAIYGIVVRLFNKYLAVDRISLLIIIFSSSITMFIYLFATAFTGGQIKTIELLTSVGIGCGIGVAVNTVIKRKAKMEENKVVK